MPASQVPGVYRAEVFPAPEVPLRTGVPAFLGLATDGPVGTPERLNLATQFGERVGAHEPPHRAVAGDAGLAAIAALDDVDLVCLPDASRLRRAGELPTLEA